MLWLAILVFSTAALGQQVYRTGPGVERPKVLNRVEAAYTSEARAARIQGIVLLEFVVSEEGRATNISVLSPLGRGLDQQATAALEQWRFRPGRKDGQPVKVLDRAEMVFHFRRAFFDWTAEKRRMRFNVAMRDLQTRDPESRTAAIRTIGELAKQKYPPAMYRFAKMLETGNGIERDPVQARDYLMRAAAKNFNTAIYEVGRMYFDGRGVAQDTEKGREMIRNAAIRGSLQAQYFLGSAYELGSGYPQNDDSARQYFRMCATAGQTQCQFRLGKLLLNREHRLERDLVQAMAWLELAASQGERRARILLEGERTKLTADQSAMVEDVRDTLLRR